LGLFAAVSTDFYHIGATAMFRTTLIAALTICTLTLVQPNQTHAQVKAFKISGSGVGPDGLPLPGQDPRMHWIVGNATHLGRHYGEGTVQTDSAALDPSTGKIAGEFGSGSPFVFVGANGDRLACYYGRTDFGAAKPGSFELTILGDLGGGVLLVQAAWIAEFVAQPDESTGKFAGVTGSWIMYAYSAPFSLGSNDPVYYSWEGSGKLTFSKKK
jgi:hypothetical protein